MRQVIKNNLNGFGEIPLNMAEAFQRAFYRKLEEMTFEEVCKSELPLIAEEKYREIYPFEKFPERYPKDFGNEKDKKIQGIQMNLPNDRKSDKKNPDQPSLF